MTNPRQEFIEHLELRGFRSRTVKNYLQCMKSFQNYHKKAPDRMGNEHVKQYLLHLQRDRKLATRSINLHYYSLRGYYLLFRNQPEVMHNFRRMKEPVYVPVILSREEVEMLLNSAVNLKVKSIIALLYSAGLRLTECSLLKINDFDKHRMVIHIKNAKGGKERYAVLSKTTQLILREYYKQYRPEDYLFAGRKGGTALCPRRYQDYIIATAKRAGITKKISPHTMRHYVESNIMGSALGLCSFLRLFSLNHSP